MGALRRRRVLRIALGALFAFGAIHHAPLVLRAGSCDLGADGAVRHAVFVLVNAAVAIGFFSRTASARVASAFAGGMLVLAAQQIMSHGGAAARAWRDEGAPHLEDVAVSLFVPFAAGLAVVAALEARQRRA